jgi:hypothetical protein
MKSKVLKLKVALLLAALFFAQEAQVSSRGGASKSYPGFTLMASWTVGHPGDGDAAMEAHDRQLSAAEARAKSAVTNNEAGFRRLLDHFISANHRYTGLRSRLDSKSTNEEKSAQFDLSRCSGLPWANDVLAALKVDFVFELSGLAVNLKKGTKPLNDLKRI